MAELATVGLRWFTRSGPDSDVVISSRIRLARNLAGFPFVNRANVRQGVDILEAAKGRITSCRHLGEGLFWVDMRDSPRLDRELLVERHLVSRQLVSAGEQTPRGVAIGADETFAIMVNEEDHLRIQVLRSGMQLAEAYEQIDRIDDALEESLDFAFNPRFGYLTACPTNVGTGLRVSVMLHLPAIKLTGQIEKVRRAARDLHLAVRGLFGEGSEALGDLYQISNQTTLGRSEAEILADFEQTVVPQIIAYEQQARAALLRDRPDQLDDRVYRAWAVLTHARLLTSEETFALLSHVRLGVNLGRLDAIDLRSLNELLLICQPAHLQRIMGKSMDPAQRRMARAKLVRQRLGA